MSRIFNQKNCECRVRESKVDQYGRMITVTGQHAFGYNIHIQDKGKITSFPYSNGTEARKAFKELTKIRNYASNRITK